jgi:hypothetical protein
VLIIRVAQLVSLFNLEKAALLVDELADSVQDVPSPRVGLLAPKPGHLAAGATEVARGMTVAGSPADWSQASDLSFPKRLFRRAGTFLRRAGVA